MFHIIKIQSIIQSIIIPAITIQLRNDEIYIMRKQLDIIFRFKLTYFCTKNRKTNIDQIQI